MSERDVMDVVADLAAKGTAGFRASYVAAQTGEQVRDVQNELVRMVDEGDLTLEFHLRCPGSGAVLKRFAQGDELPIGEEIDADDCEPFIVDTRDFWVAYVPTRALLTKLLQEERSGKAGARRRGLRRRALRALGIDSIRHLFSRASTTT